LASGIFTLAHAPIVTARSNHRFFNLFSYLARFIAYSGITYNIVSPTLEARFLSSSETLTNIVIFNKNLDQQV
jgi:hypothetical protein